MRLKTNQRTFDECFNEFQAYNKIKNLRPATIKFYEQNIVHFKRYVADLQMNTITEDNIYGFILHLQEHYDNATTINTYLRCTRAFLYYCMKHDYIQRFEIKLIKEDRQIKEVYSDDDIIKLLKKPDLKRCSFTQYRDWVIVQYLLETGNRLSSVTGIKVEDVDINASMVTLKNTKNRIQAYSPVGCTLLKVMVQYIHEWGLGPNDYLFPNIDREKLTSRALQKSLYKYNKAHGVNMTGIHRFRNTFARSYVVNGGGAFKLQRLLGHSDISMTQRYVNLFSKDLIEDFDKYSIIDAYNRSDRIKRYR